MFRTPSLRNTARRQSFFHNGVYHSLIQVLDFYNLRDTGAERIYSSAASHDLPPRYRANIDRIDRPFGAGQPAMSAGDEQDIIAFLNTLSDE
jgi:cytochrome c peroxidase